MANAPDRRTFLAWAGLGAMAGLPGRLLAQRLNRVGYHLVSARRGGAADVPGALRVIAAIGYPEVEFGSVEELDLVATRRLLDSLRLAAPSRHVQMSDVFSNWRNVLNDCRILGNRQVVCEEVPAAERSTLEGYRRVADLLNSAGQITQWAGVQLAVRPHADDLRARGGVVPYEYLLANTSPVLVKFQLDLSVMAAAKRDVVEDIGRYRGRFVSLHITGGDAGLGLEPTKAATSDLVKLLASAQRAGSEHVFVRDDQPDPSADRAKAAFAYLSTLELK